MKPSTPDTIILVAEERLAAMIGQESFDVGATPHFRGWGTDAGTLVDLYQRVRRSTGVVDHDICVPLTSVFSAYTPAQTVIVFRVDQTAVRDLAEVTQEQQERLLEDWQRSDTNIRYTRQPEHHENYIKAVTQLAGIANKQNTQLLLKVRYRPHR